MAWIARALAAAAVALAALPTAAADLYNNTNTGAVQSNPAHQPVFLSPYTVHITQIVTYHWNDGRGAKPGTITLKSANGPVYGPFQAKGTSGQGNAPNVNWIADVDFTIPIGTYQVIDSDPATWSQNAESHSVGFAIIRGEHVTQAAPSVPTSTGGGMPPPRPPGVVHAPLAPNPGRGIPVPPTPTAFHPCGVNAGSIAAISPCQGAPGTKIGIRLSRKLSSPLAKVVFKPYQVTGIAGGTGAQVIAAVKGGATASGSIYEVDAPRQLCLGHGGSWDLFPVDARGRAQGDIGRFTVDCRPGVVPTGGAPSPTPAPTPPAPAPSPFQPCFTNSGSIGASSPCNGHPGDLVTIKLSRSLTSPLAKVVFKPYAVYGGLPGATPVQVVATLNGSGVSAGSTYTTPAPQQLCVAGNASWDLWPFDAKGTGQGDIGRINIICH